MQITGTLSNEVFIQSPYRLESSTPSKRCTGRSSLPINKRMSVVSTRYSRNAPVGATRSADIWPLETPTVRQYSDHVHVAQQRRGHNFAHQPRADTQVACPLWIFQPWPHRPFTLTVKGNALKDVATVAGCLPGDDCYQRAQRPFWTSACCHLVIGPSPKAPP